jgi:DNA-binding transcriptional LysR family regulator
VALHNMGLQRNVVMRVQNYLVAARIIEQTDLVWTVPKVLADTLPLAVAELPFAVESLGWNLFWHKNADNDPATQWIRTRVCELVARVVADNKKSRK